MAFAVPDDLGELCDCRSSRRQYGSAPRGLPPPCSSMSGCFSRTLSSAPVRLDVIAVGAAGEGDARANWGEHLDIGAPPRGDEFSEVSERCDDRSAARPPGGAGLDLLELGRVRAGIQTRYAVR